MNSIPISEKIPELDIAIKAANDAGKAVLEIYEKDFDSFSKTDDSPITEADLKSNEIIKEILFNRLQYKCSKILFSDELV